MNCPLKPGISCASASAEMIESTPCPGCPSGRASGRSRRPEPVRAKLIGVVRVRDGDRGLLRWVDAVETEIGYSCEDHVLQEDDEPAGGERR